MIIHVCVILHSTMQDEAKQQYIALVEELAGSEVSVEATPVSTGKYTTLDVTNEAGVFTIKLNRPSKKNAINFEVNYGEGKN